MTGDEMILGNQQNVIIEEPLLGKVGDGLVELRMHENELELTDGTLSLSADLTRMLPRLKTANLRQEMLVKAAKYKKEEGRIPFAVDATAGFGEDALLLAAAGYRVLLCEYDEVIAALLADALRRAAEVPELAEYAARMKLVQKNSIQVLQELDEKPDAVLLDPMFPARQKSALVKKKFQLLHHLESPCTDENELFAAACASGAKKVIIKRPLKGPFLAEQKPSYSLKGKAIRYDVIVRAAN
ncbi:MAG: class I SAM-dependent methyltransferase [Lachnospiraceae bacterium]|nr:class I SAM-dependent methyltransferase [Lachnospiraceae bacterium]